MPNQTTLLKHQLCPSRWSNRIVIAAVAGILFLTLYPFRFDWHVVLPGNASPFLLGDSGKSAGLFDNFLNVLLFIPLGFGLSDGLRDNGKSRTTTLFLVLLAGVLLSYGIEFTQVFIPARDSGWEDILYNTIGAGAGFFLFEASNGILQRSLLGWEQALTGWISMSRAVLVLLIYFCVWFAVSAFLQTGTRLSNWVPDTQLVVGNDAAGRVGRAWKGRMFRLQLWDRPLPESVARNLTAGVMADGDQSGMVAAYDFSGPPPVKDRGELLPDLFWTPPSQASQAPNEIIFDGRAWLTSNASASPLVADLQKKNRFSLLVVCAPSDLIGSDGRIVSISNSSGLVNLTLRQEDTSLAFWFRNPISVRRAQLTWYIPDTFSLNQIHSILYSYDGSNLDLYIDGERKHPIYRLGPGTAMAQLLRRVKPSELEGYNYIYYALVFVPAGSLLGLAARKLGLRHLAGFLVMPGCLVLAAFALECILVSVSGRAFSLRNIVFSLCCAVAAGFWFNSDWRTPSESG